MASQYDDAEMRLEAFKRVRHLQQIHPHLTAQEFESGFQFRGERVPLVNPQRGIFKPRQMRYLLSIKTVYPRPGAKVWYDDQRDIHRKLFGSAESVDYAFMGTNPDAADNRWLKEAFERQVPIIYFLGIAPGKYRAIWPVFISGWDPESLKATVAFGSDLVSSAYESARDEPLAAFPEDAQERRYALRVVKQRLHQATFREAIITAYRGRCAVSGIPEPMLLDAAHIIADSDERLGQPIVPNGLPLSKIHHAAFDAHLIGIDPDYRIHVSDRLLEKEDGPLLESLKGLDGNQIGLPKRFVDNPDRDRLAERFARFESASVPRH